MHFQDWSIAGREGVCSRCEF